MPSIRDLTLVTVENFHIVVPEFLNSHKILITSYEDMMEAIAQMVQEKHLFNMDRDLLRSMMEDQLSCAVQAMILTNVLCSVSSIR